MKSTRFKLRKSKFLFFEKKYLVSYDDLLYFTFFFWIGNSFIILTSMRKQKNSLFKMLWKNCVRVMCVSYLSSGISFFLIPAIFYYVQYKFKVFAKNGILCCCNYGINSFRKQKKWWCKFFFSSTKWWEAEKEIVDQYKKRKPSEVATRGVPWKRCS